MKPLTDKQSSPIVEKESPVVANGEDTDDLQCQDSPPMEWKFFLGACFLTAALVVPYAGPRAVIAGMALAALIQWAWRHIHRR
jgi:hypothetical protein